MVADLTFEELVDKERERQDAKWGALEGRVGVITPYQWVAIATEELGEMARAVLHTHQPDEPNPYSATEIETELIQTVAALKCYWQILQWEKA